MKKNNVGAYAALSIIGLFVFFPVFWILSISLRPNGEVFGNPLKLWPKTLTFEAYANVLGDPQMLSYFFNSYLNGMIVTLVAIVLGIMAGYALSRYGFRGKIFLNGAIIATQTIPSVTLIIPFFILMVDYNLYDTRFGLILAYISFALPYTIVMMVGYFNSISPELDEAARIDGASDWRTLWQIIVPIARPGIVSAVIYAFILSWNEFVFATTLIRDDALKTFRIGIAMPKGETSFEWNMMMAMSLLGSIPVIIIYLIGQKQFISGLASGGVKG